MKVLPVVERELRAIARRPSAYWMRSGAALASFVAIGYVALIGAAGLPAANQGRNLFEILSLCALIYCLLAGVRGTSDALSGEKREGTLGLLFLTDLKGYDVVIGKLVSVSINSVYGIFAIAPALALAFMVGGTSGTQFLLMLTFLLNTLFFSLAVGICVSTFSQQERPAMGATLAIVFCVLVVPYAVAIWHTFGILEIWQALEPGFLLESPAFAYWAIKDATLSRIYFDDILRSMAFTNLCGWLCLVYASASIAQRAHTDAQRGRIAAWFARVRYQWAYGKTERRRAIRGRLLNRNAFAWLAGRDRLKGRYAWTFLFLFAALCWAAHWKAPEMTDEWPIILFAIWFVHLFFKVWVASEVAARFIEDRRSNALELLLTTSLRVREFVAGERMALARQFGAPLAVIVAINLYAGLHASDSSAFLLRSPNPLGFFIAGLPHLGFDLYAIHWVAIWRSLHLRGTNRTITQSIFLVVFLPVIGWFLLWQAAWLFWRFGATAPAGEQILWLWTALCVIYDLVLAAIARGAFYRDFREAATAAFDKPGPMQWPWRKGGSAVRKAKPIRFSRARKIAIAFGCVALAFYAAVLVRRHRLAAAAQARLAAVRRTGLPTTVMEAAQWRYSPPAAKGASGVLRGASRHINAMAYLPQLTDSQAHWQSRERLSPEFKTRAEIWMRDASELFKTLELLPSREPGGGVFDERLRTGVRAEDIGRRIQLKARLELDDAPGAATDTISLMLHLARCLEGEPFGGYGGSPKVLEGSIQLLERAAIQGGFSADQWRQWKSILIQMDPQGALRSHLVIARADGLATFSLPVDVLYDRYGRHFGDFQGLFNVGWAIRRFLGQDNVEIIQYLDETSKNIALADRPFWEVHGELERFAWHAPSLASRTIIAPQVLPSFDWLYTSATQVSAYQRILITVCDIEIYRAENGNLPPDLNSLNSLARLDPFSGDPLHYLIRGGREYSVYSVGADLQDNGGAKYAAHRTGDLAFHCGQLPEAKRERKYP